MTSKSTALRGKHLGAQRGSEVVSVLGAGEAVVTVMNSPEKEREREREMRGERGLERVRERGRERWGERGGGECVQTKYFFC